MSYGPRHAIADRYGQDVQVDVDMGDAEVCLSWHEEEPTAAGLKRRYVLSALAPDQADALAGQLRAAAAEARNYTPHD